GWNEKPPTLSQRLAPPTLLPIPGNKVAHVAANASNHKTGIPVQYKVSGISLAVPPGAYSATVVYTVVDL
ncbi:hypothetical protein, partial [Acetomicrobium sp. S15 = DSM 107314]|uniref:hypothetical protein n=1 Tax=Acetomicrobium sp. S15 = DSM 107314 TaxID=2529858 RepID=UPI0018E1D54E